MQLGLPLPERKRLIKQLTATRSEKKYSFRFQGTLQQFDVYIVRIELPKYRLSNGRTQALQEQLLAAKPGLPRDLFSADQESELAQTEQHQLLKTLLPAANLYNYFKKNKQDEALILTNIGIVVNGNRRLCAMRELLEADPRRYAHFGKVQVVFLPPCDEKDIDELEAELQIREDIKAQYSWVARACMMRRRQAEHGYSPEVLGHLYGMKPDEVTEQLEMLGLADEYLETSGTPKNYDSVIGDEFAFKALRKELRKPLDTKDLLLGKELSFRLIKHPPEGTGRLHTFIPNVFENIPVISKGLDSELGKPAVQAETATRPPRDRAGDIKLLGPPTPQFKVNPELRNDERADSINSVVVDAVEGERAKKRQLKRENSVVENLVSAHTSLTMASVALSSATYKKEIRLQLDSVESALAEFKRQLKKYDHP